MREGVDHDQGEHAKQDDHDGEDRDQRGRPARPADLVTGHLPERLAVPAHGQEQHDHVLHGAREDHSGDDPQGAGQVAHLGREDRADQRSGAGDRGEVVPEEDPLVGGVEVDAVFEAFGRGGAAVVRFQDAPDDEAGVEAVGDRIRAERGDDQPDRGDLLAPGQREHAPGDRAEQCDGGPYEDRSS
ncbi:hypothetical protein M2155_001382 [Streptomyces sp. SAI-119]|nr:hypothetical protein [Streptomyces sp. SAI-119]